MIDNNKQYPAKLLLFGEYGILSGLKALAVPFRKFYGELEFKEDLNNSLLLLFAYLKSINHELKYNLDLKKLDADIRSGLYFKSSIPQNYGLGSSGALVAALFENYQSNNINLKNIPLHILKSDLAKIESFFHGKSSGIDPLISLINSPLLFENNQIETVKANFKFPKNSGFFLLDSHTTGKTSGLVQSFLKKLEDKLFKEIFMHAYTTFSNGAIDCLLTSDFHEFIEKFIRLSEYQLNEMKDLIPPSVQKIFKDGINKGKHMVKICGSGGGGYFLGFSTDIATAKQDLESGVLYL